VPKKSMKSGVTLDIRSILNAPDRMEADRLLGSNFKFGLSLS